MNRERWSLLSRLVGGRGASNFPFVLFFFSSGRGELRLSAKGGTMGSGTGALRHMGSINELEGVKKTSVAPPLFRYYLEPESYCR